MAQFEHLHVFNSSYDLLVIIFRLTKDFQKEYKYTIGERLKNLLLDLMMLVQKANGSVEAIRRVEEVGEIEIIINYKL